MTDCRVYRRIPAKPFLFRGSQPLPVWFAGCPRCGDEVHGGRAYPWGPTTRKNTKDALYRHLRSCA